MKNLRRATPIVLAAVTLLATHGGDGGPDDD
jgi:hypothetical protein